VRKTGQRMPGELWTPITKGRLESLAAIPICAYVGYNGMGKSAAAAATAMFHADAGRPVLGTARLTDWNNPRPCADVLCEWPSHGEDGHLAAHPMWRPLTDYRQLFTFSDGHVWADEATGLADARSHQSMPGEVSDYLPRMRAKQVTFHWTTIHWSFADVRLRRVTWAALWAVGLLPKYHGTEIWGRNRLFYYRLFDAKNLADDFEPAKRDESVKAMMRSWVWGPRWSAFGAYDSLDGVSSLGGTDESGMCLLCGGHRGKKRCNGHDAPGDDAAPPRARRSRRRSGDTPVPVVDPVEYLPDAVPERAHATEAVT
jgi:hypothetical protein